MNSRTIMRELADEIGIGLLSPNEYSQICAEAKCTLEQDPICATHYTRSLHAVLPFLTDPPTMLAPQTMQWHDDSQRFTQFRLNVADFATLLQPSYFHYLTADLAQAIRPNNQALIKSLTCSIISDLVDRGWPLETLFNWPMKFFRPLPAYSFDDNLRFMFKVLNLDAQEFQVTLKISKCSSLPAIGNHGQFSFSSDAGVTECKGAETMRFLTQFQSVCFAKTTVNSFDHRSAAITAHENLHQLVDLLRFGFEPDKVVIDNTCHVSRSSDDKDSIIILTHMPPNPTDDIPHKDVLSFSGDLDIISRKSSIDTRSKRQLNAAIRQYRFGRDVEDYKDKLLYWWMGLEALARGDKGNIGETVTQNVGHCMSMIYLRQLLDDFLATLRFCRVEWPHELADLSHTHDLRSLSSEDLLTVIQSEKHKKALLGLCACNPILHYYGENLFDTLCDPNKTAQLLQQHSYHLRWQLSRLYRIRCSIVHGSDTRYNLRLFTANLEYYLRQTILTSISTFRDHDHITTLHEIFMRASISFTRALASLSEEGAAKDTIRDVVFSELVLS